MQINRISKQVEDGSYIAELQITAEQAAFLINFAIGFLIQEGTVRIFDLKEGEQPPEAEIAKEFLENVDLTKLHKA